MPLAFTQEDFLVIVMGFLLLLFKERDGISEEVFLNRMIQ